MTDIGILGLATMGRSLALNFLDHDVSVAGWNLEPELTQALSAQQSRFVGCDTVRDVIGRLARPRRLLMMIKAGPAVDELIEHVAPHLEPGDILIDGGNSHFADTRRRGASLAAREIEFAGLGVSGGERGARTGPSLMFGGSNTAWTELAPLLDAIAARSHWGTCATRLGPDGAGHFVKMVHNAIEYADMQLIAETYAVLERGCDCNHPAMAGILERWGEGPLESYLLELTRRVLLREGRTPGSYLVDEIVDAAEQKGTGRWAAQVALELGVPIPSIAAAIDARFISNARRDRQQMARIYPPAPLPPTMWDKPADTLHDALLAARICAYAQGMNLLKAGGDAYAWQIELADVARVWSAGCIIRSRLLDSVIDARAAESAETDLIRTRDFRATLGRTMPALRRVAAWAAHAGVPLPAFSASLTWFDGIRSARLPQNLTQAQRDAFGAHTYRRLDAPDEPVHTDDWLP